MCKTRLHVLDYQAGFCYNNTVKQDKIKEQKMKVAIITGASAGLGKEFFYEIANKHDEIDEIWLVARRRDRMEKLAAEFRDKWQS